MKTALQRQSFENRVRQRGPPPGPFPQGSKSPVSDAIPDSVVAFRVAHPSRRGELNIHDHQEILWSGCKTPFRRTSYNIQLSSIAHRVNVILKFMARSPRSPRRFRRDVPCERISNFALCLDPVMFQDIPRIYYCRFVFLILIDISTKAN